MTGPLPWVGGKRYLAAKLIRLFPPHTTYIEPFAGGAQTLFRKLPSRVEVLNDLDGSLINFYRVCQHHHGELIRYLHFTIVSRKLHQLYRATPPETLTDVQRAALFYFLIKNSFGGLVRKQNFHYGITQPSNYNPRRIPEIIEAAHQRLARVQVECRPYEEVLKTFDRKSSLFLLDPPYYGVNYYNLEFTPTDFQLLRDRIAALRGKVILTLNDTPEVRILFHDFRILETEMVYTAQRRPQARRFRELIILNFKPASL